MGRLGGVKDAKRPFGAVRGVRIAAEGAQLGFPFGSAPCTVTAKQQEANGSAGGFSFKSAGGFGGPLAERSQGAAAWEATVLTSAGGGFGAGFGPQSPSAQASAGQQAAKPGASTGFSSATTSQTASGVAVSAQCGTPFRGFNANSQQIVTAPTASSSNGVTALATQRNGSAPVKNSSGATSLNEATPSTGFSFGGSTQSANVQNTPSPALARGFSFGGSTQSESVPITSSQEKATAVSTLAGGFSFGATTQSENVPTTPSQENTTTASELARGFSFGAPTLSESVPTTTSQDTTAKASALARGFRFGAPTQVECVPTTTSQDTTQPDCRTLVSEKTRGKASTLAQGFSFGGPMQSVNVQTIPSPTLAHGFSFGSASQGASMPTTIGEDKTAMTPSPTRSFGGSPQTASASALATEKEENTSWMTRPSQQQFSLGSGVNISLKASNRGKSSGTSTAPTYSDKKRRDSHVWKKKTPDQRQPAFTFRGSAAPMIGEIVSTGSWPSSSGGNIFQGVPKTDMVEVIFVEGIGGFPYHLAVQCCSGDITRFMNLIAAMKIEGVNVNSSMKVLVKKAEVITEINASAAEYAFLLGYKEVGSYLAQKMQFEL